MHTRSSVPYYATSCDSGGGEGPLEHVLHPVGPSYYELVLAISSTTSSMHYILYELVIYY